MLSWNLRRPKWAHRQSTSCDIRQKLANSLKALQPNKTKCKIILNNGRKSLLNYCCTWYSSDHAEGGDLWFPERVPAPYSDTIMGLLYFWYQLSSFALICLAINSVWPVSLYHEKYWLSIMTSINWLCFLPKAKKKKLYNYELKKVWWLETHSKVLIYTFVTCKRHWSSGIQSVCLVHNSSMCMK